MKLLVHASIFSVVFAGFVASALTTKVTAHVTSNHSLVGKKERVSLSLKFPWYSSLIDRNQFRVGTAPESRANIEPR